jgi:SnoaL-like domain
MPQLLEKRFYLNVDRQMLNPSTSGIKTMNAMEISQRYFEAWNRHDAEAIVGAFAEGGTYSDPTGGQGLHGEPLASYAKGLWQAFPDLSFEIISSANAGADMVAAQWLMRRAQVLLPRAGCWRDDQCLDFRALQCLDALPVLYASNQHRKG